ncbi:MAG: endolytic transglycosylase MltG [Methylobacter sp.]|nr:MAG: endolytic transglycosylase MltG [Methylobacter sp.]
MEQLPRGFKKARIVTVRYITLNNKVIGFTLLVLCFAGGWLLMDYQSALHQPALVDKTVYIEIEKGDSLDRIIDKLIGQGLAVKPFWFKVIAFQENALKKLKTGEYELTSGLTAPQILSLFVQGKTKQHVITFPEGWSFKDVLHEIELNPNLEHTLNGVDFSNIMAKFKSGPSAFAWPEGLFFPDTYFFEKHTSDLSLLQRAYDKMQQVLQQEWLNKAEGLPYKSPYEALILASIVEKETGAAAERPQIAGVFIRRLEKNMLLQTDPTVIYGMGDRYQGDIKYQDLTTATPYNTYVINGLPPTPIAMPGRDALYAVLHPDQGDSLYFVARGDGTHVFSATLKEHNLAVDKFQRNKK